MSYDEYKSTLEEILVLTEQIEIICKNKQIDEIEEPFKKRDTLFKKLSIPDDITEEQLKYIIELRDKIQEKNEFILRYFNVTKNEIKKELLNIKEENKIIDAYKIQNDSIKSSMFDYLE